MTSSDGPGDDDLVDSRDNGPMMLASATLAVLATLLLGATLLWLICALVGGGK